MLLDLTVQTFMPIFYFYLELKFISIFIISISFITIGQKLPENNIVLCYVVCALAFMWIFT